jgi:hypothetical protein
MVNHLKKWVTREDSACLVLGDESYLMVEGKPEDQVRSWTLVYEPLTINLMGVMAVKVILEEEVWKLLVDFTVEDKEFGQISLTMGSSDCLDITSLKFCVRWEPNEDIEKSKPSPNLDIFVEVGNSTTDASRMSLDTFFKTAGYDFLRVFSADSGPTTAPSPKPFTSTKQCILALAEKRVACLADLSEGSTLPVEECDKTVEAMDLIGATSCRCNPAVSSLLGLLESETCATRVWEETYEYGCAASDASVDAQRFESLRRYKAAFSKPRDELLAELEAVLSFDAIVDFFGIGKYTGVQGISEFGLTLNTGVNSGLLVAGLPESISEISMDAGGFQSRALDRMYVLSDRTEDVDDAELKYVQGSFSSIQFVSCSGTISGVVKALDDFSFTTMTKTLNIIPNFGPHNMHDQGLFHSAIASIKYYESLRTNDCIQGIFLKSVHLYKMQTLVGSESRCLILGETSYFKMSDALTNEKSFALKYVTILKTVNVDGHLKYFQKSDNLYVVEIASGGNVLGSIEVDIGENKCMNIFLVKFCVSTLEDTRARRLAGGHSGKLHLEVDGEKTEPIVLWNETTTASTTSSPVQISPDKPTAYSFTILLHMAPMALIAISMH